MEHVSFIHAYCHVLYLREVDPAARVHTELHTIVHIQAPTCTHVRENIELEVQSTPSDF